MPWHGDLDPLTSVNKIFPLCLSNFSSRTVKIFCCSLSLCNISCNLHKNIGVFNSISLCFCRSWEDQGVYRCLPFWLSSSCRWWYWPRKSCHAVSRSRQHSEDIHVSTWSQENNSIEMHESISSHQSSESWNRNTDETSVDALLLKCIIQLMYRISVIVLVIHFSYECWIKKKASALTILCSTAATVTTGSAQALSEGLFQQFTYRIMPKLPLWYRECGFILHFME